MQIYVAKSGHQTGPFSQEQIQSMLQSGMIGLDDSAWREGLSSWLPLHQVLKGCPPVAQTLQPPPLPETSPQKHPDEQTRPDPIIQGAIKISFLRKQLRPGLIVLDVVIIWILNWVGSFLLRSTSGRSYVDLNDTQFVLTLLGNVIIFGTVGFTISGCLVPSNRWRHLGLVAFVFWLLMGFINIFYLGLAAADWLKSAPIVAINMGLGGALSYLFRRASQSPSHVSR